MSWFSISAPDYYRREFTKLDRLVAPHVETAADGFQHVGESCPRPLVVYYRNLVSLGYARGWLRRPPIAGRRSRTEQGVAVRRRRRVAATVRRDRYLTRWLVMS